MSACQARNSVLSPPTNRLVAEFGCDNKALQECVMVKLEFALCEGITTISCKLFVGRDLSSVLSETPEVHVH